MKRAGGSATTKFLKEVLRTDSKRSTLSLLVETLSSIIFSPLSSSPSLFHRLCFSYPPTSLRVTSLAKVSILDASPLLIRLPADANSHCALHRCCKPCTILPNDNSVLEFILIMGQFQSLVIYKNFPRRASLICNVDLIKKAKSESICEHSLQIARHIYTRTGIHNITAYNSEIFNCFKIIDILSNINLSIKRNSALYFSEHILCI